MGVVDVFFLLIVFQLKQFFADFVDEGCPQSMQPRRAVSRALLRHAAVHAYFTFAIAIFFGFYSIPSSVVVGVAMLDFLVHFLVDWTVIGVRQGSGMSPMSAGEIMNAQAIARGYAVLDNGLEAPYNRDAVLRARKRLSGHRWFWILSGADQAIHHLTHYLIIFILLQYKV